MASLFRVAPSLPGAVQQQATSRCEQRLVVALGVVDGLATADRANDEPGDLPAVDGRPAAAVEHVVVAGGPCSQRIEEDDVRVAPDAERALARRNAEDLRGVRREHPR